MLDVLATSRVVKVTKCQEDRETKAEIEYQRALQGSSTMISASRRYLFRYAASSRDVFPDDVPHDVSLTTDAGRVGGYKCLFTAVMSSRNKKVAWAPPQVFDRVATFT